MRGERIRRNKTNTTKPKKRNPGGHNGLPASTEPRETQLSQPPPCPNIYLPTNPHMGSWLALHTLNSEAFILTRYKSQRRAAWHTHTKVYLQALRAKETASTTL